ncbi:hypothetical protein GCM10007907_16620 [Chitinimonas prasina]|uniref:Uncharacterized protein n=1 Tax=Chitinimonas prasina TaxID=1434937 RepID=A0ABQ5YD31_9NEIS|nr:hypothetical protein [Chitinimonas prasina]GLR12872.1 hypothetical protein GCM10007907_16620 [Chitinimonas prasina]
MTDNERIEAIAASIMRYLGIRPQSADTLEGIHRWWVEWGDQEAPPLLTEKALHKLEASGQLESTQIAGRLIWRLPRRL